MACLSMPKFKPDQFIVEKEKVTRYLLNTDHPDGGSKAKFFIGYGFDPTKWYIFADAIREHASNNPIVLTEDTSFGTKYIS
jgi:hypothetical protein